MEGELNMSYYKYYYQSIKEPDTNLWSKETKKINDTAIGNLVKEEIR